MIGSFSHGFASASKAASVDRHEEIPANAATAEWRGRQATTRFTAANDPLIPMVTEAARLRERLRTRSKI